MKAVTLSLALLMGVAVAPAAWSLELPAPAVAREQLSAAGISAEPVTVLEPHLARKGRMPEVRYVGFPANAALAQWLGADWNAAGRELELRALDGFVSRIPVERFAQHRAWLVIAREDGKPFQVDNHLQGEKQVPLGPFYLVWDNRRSKALQAEGGALWPYQVAAVSSGPSSTKALLPGDMAKRYGAAADLARTHCLSCHRIRGYGGDKMPLDLDVAVKGFDAAAWRRWLLTPSAVRPGTTMPALAEGRPDAERAAIARQLYDYLHALPPR